MLGLISALKLEHYQIVFSGGTALAKSSIRTYRMSEDIDLKLVPTPDFIQHSSRNARREARKAVKQLIDKEIRQSSCFSTEGAAQVRDEYRYFCFDIRYPQAYQQAPSLRPFIKMEFTESELLSQPQKRDIQSIYAEVLKGADEVSGLYCASILDTQAEKLLSMLRRTASLARDGERNDDKALIRHIYDTYHIQQAEPSDLNELASLFKKAMQADIERFGNQHPQMVESPLQELRYGLKLLESDSIHFERYKD
nr:nucleotidyl transferase AbiEii/AbiGii toxin family protein [Bowmanella dokdonensis]